MMPIAFVPALMIAALVYAETARSGSWSLGHFTAYLAATVRRNLPLGSAVRAYGEELPVWRIFKRKALADVADVFEGGLFLSDALDQHPGVFPKRYRALVRSAENGGGLARVLGALADIAELDESTLRRASGYAFYPAVVAFSLTGVMGIVHLVVAPKFNAMFAEMGTAAADTSMARLSALPAIAGVVYLVFFPIVLAGLVCPWLLGAVGEGAPSLRRAASWLTWHMPFISRYERRRAAAQYALVAGKLLEAGLPTTDALSLAATSSGSLELEKIANAASSQVAEGEKLSDALGNADRRGQLPAELLWYVEVGESSGRLPEALLRASESAFARSRSALSRFVSLLFPIGILALAYLVGSLAYAVFDCLATLTMSLT